ncbi:hypothetical protein BDV11DRAFT_70175 [Aspergillus similis]
MLGSPMHVIKYPKGMGILGTRYQHDPTADTDPPKAFSDFDWGAPHTKVADDGSHYLPWTVCQPHPLPASAPAAIEPGLEEARSRAVAAPTQTKSREDGIQPSWAPARPDFLSALPSRPRAAYPPTPQRPDRSVCLSPVLSNAIFSRRLSHCPLAVLDNISGSAPFHNVHLDGSILEVDGVLQITTLLRLSWDLLERINRGVRDPSV